MQSIANLDASAEIARFVAETGSQDPDELLAYLRKHDHISGGAFCRSSSKACRRSAPAGEKPAGTTGIVWGDLRADRRGKGLIMPAAPRIHDADGNLAAVTGMETQFDFLAKRLLPMDGAPPYVDAGCLVQPDIAIGGDRKLVAFTPLAAMGWTYVVVADEGQRMAAERI